MKKLILCAVLFSASVSANAQGYKETFDSNSLEWTECAYANGIGTTIINNGTMTIQSKGVRIGFSKLTGGIRADVKDATFFETHCYAPIDVMKPFEVHALVNVKNFTDDTLVGLVFNYKDNGNFYTFSFNNLNQ